MIRFPITRRLRGFEIVTANLQREDTLVVWRLDRLGRSMRHLVNMIEYLKERGIGFCSISDGMIVTTSASGELVLMKTSARHNLGWIPQQLRENSALASYPLTQFDEHGVRPACSVIYGMTVLLKSSGFDQNVVGLSRQAALGRTVKLLRGIVATHKSNTGGAQAGAITGSRRFGRHSWVAVDGSSGTTWTHPPDRC